MVKDGYVIYKIYRLVDSRYPPKHENYVRYVGRTYRELKQRLWEHNRYCPTADVESDWLKLPVLEIQLVECVDTRAEAELRERHWIGLHRRAGYNLLNVLKIQRAAPPRDTGDLLKIREEIESRIAGVTPPEVPHECEGGKRHRTLEQFVLDLIETGQVTGEDAELLLQAIGKA